MQWRQILKIFESYLYGFSAILCIPLLIAGYYEFIVDANEHPHPHSTLAFAQTIIVCLAIARILSYCNPAPLGQLLRRESIALVVIIWFVTPAIAALPFMFNGTLNHFHDAYFEATSGLTTTGISVMQGKEYDPKTGKEVPIQVQYSTSPELQYKFYGTITPVVDPQTGAVTYSGVEAVGKGLLFWRSFTQTLGGIGIIVLFIIILPALGVGTKVLFQSETVGPTKDSLAPRIRETAVWLCRIYLFLIALQVILLMVMNSKMQLFDAVTLSLATISTGGFSIKNNSIAFYQSPETEWILIVFMLLGGVNFALYYSMLKGRLYRLKDPEFLAYIGVVVALSAVIFFALVDTPRVLFDSVSGIYNVYESIRLAVFHLVSAVTTTGFVTVDYDFWPFGAQALLFVAMFVGGMSGSTSGSIKVIRHLILTKSASHRIETVFRPETVRISRVGNAEISPQIASSVFCFFFIYIAISMLGTLFYIFDGVDPESALSLVGCNINNVGLAFRQSGPTQSAAFLSPFSKYLSCFLMITGRLEVFVVLITLIPAFWRKN